MSTNKFTDSKGRAWTLEIGWPAYQRVKAMGIDLDALVPSKDMPTAQIQASYESLQELIYSPTQFPLVLLAILAPQIKTAGVSEADFHEGFETSDAIDGMISAFMEGLKLFIRCPIRRTIFAKVILWADRAQAMGVKKLNDKTEALMAKAAATAEAEAEAKIDDLLNSGSTN